MNHLAEAKMHAQRAEGKGSAWAQLDALLAIVHIGIAWIERMDKAAEDTEAAAERAKLARAYADQDTVGWHDINDNLL